MQIKWGAKKTDYEKKQLINEWKGREKFYLFMEQNRILHGIAMQV